MRPGHARPVDIGYLVFRDETVVGRTDVLEDVDDVLGRALGTMR
jgi:hypothetical protein